MTVQEAQMGRLERHRVAGPIAVEERHEARWRPVARFFVAIGVAGSIVALVWHRVPHPLSARTDIVGHPIQANFNINRYIDAYYLLLIAFPALAVGGFLLVARFGPLRVRRGDQRREAASRLSPTDEARGLLSPTLSRLASLAIPATAAGIEVASVRADRHGLPPAGGILAGTAYLIGVLVLSRLTVAWRGRARPEGRRRPSRPATEVLAATNALVAPLLIPGLYFVSRSTTVFTGTPPSAHRYPWLPLWLVAVLTAGAYALILRGVRGDAQRTQGAVVAFLVGPVLLFVATAQLPGTITFFDTFGDGELLAGARLTFHGHFPWRDLFFIHGLLGDVFSGQIGLSVFSNTAWGSWSGLTMLVYPLCWVTIYYFAAYFFGRNRLLLAGFAIAIAFGLVSFVMPRFVLLPVLFILFDQMLRRRSRWWCMLFMASLVVETVITPETGLAALAFLATITVHDVVVFWKTRSVRSSLFFIGWCAVSGAALTVLLAALLAATGALAGFVEYFKIFAVGHNLAGSWPPQWTLSWSNRPTIEFFLPGLLILATVWTIVARARHTGTLARRDWVIVAAGIFALVYFDKALARLDTFHVAESFSATTPLLLLLLAELSTVVDRTAGQLAARLRARRRAAPAAALRVLRPITAVAVIAVALLSPQASSAMRRMPDHFTATAAPSPAPGMGYATGAALDPSMLADLKTVLDTYAGPHGAVFDFSNDPAVLYYLLARDPGTRFYDVAMAIPAGAQHALINDLRKSKPPVVVYNSSTAWMSHWDDIPNMVRHYDVSQYLLDNYRPLLQTTSNLIMIRNDLFASAPPPPPLRTPAVTTNLAFSAQVCDWGYSPNFLKTPATVTHLRGQTLQLGPPTLAGWAVDAMTGLPSTEVFAIKGDRVIAQSAPQIARPDVVNVLHSPAALLSGFRLPLYGQNDGTYPVAALNRDGTVTFLSGPANAGGLPTTVTGLDGRSHKVVSGSAGFVESSAPAGERTLPIVIPPGFDLAGARWLVLQSSGSLGDATFTLTDAPGNASHNITFRSLPRSGGKLYVHVGSCLQWRSFTPSQLVLITNSTAPLTSVQVTS